MSPILDSLGSAKGYGWSGFSLSTAFESIASATGTGSSPNILFSSIPQTFKHLQLRILGRSSDTSNQASRYLFVQCNNDYPSVSNYSWHGIYGLNSTVSTDAAVSYPTVGMYGRGISQDNNSSSMAGAIIDIHDYTSTSKFKTIRYFGGSNIAPNSSVALYAGTWRSTSAITSLRISIDTANWSTNTQIALYGIKG